MTYVFSPKLNGFILVFVSDANVIIEESTLTVIFAPASSGFAVIRNSVFLASAVPV